MTLEEKRAYFTKWFNLWVEGVELEHKRGGSIWTSVHPTFSEASYVPGFEIAHELRIKPRVFEEGRHYPLIKNGIQLVGCWSGVAFFVQGYPSFVESNLDWIGEALPEDLWLSTT